MHTALAGARVFDGERMLDGHTVVLEGARIAAVVPERELPAGVRRETVEGLLAPGFIDLQVNGGGGVLFNDDPSPEAIRAICEAHRPFGSTGLLPTFITDERHKMYAAIEATRAALDAGIPGCLGVHLEGPFISPERKGVHEPKFMRVPDEEDLTRIASLKSGRTLVTVAPERVPMDWTRRLAQAGVLICAGHTAGSYEVVAESLQNGVTGFTHLFNAMPPLAGREPGPVGAALADADSYSCLIVDGWHVADASLRVAIKAKGVERTILVTDAMSSVGSDLTTFDLLGKTIHRANGRLTTADGTLAGSDLDMASAVRNTVERLDVALPDALRMASLSPAAYLGLDRELGRIAPGYRASLVLLDETLHVSRTWIDGAPD